MIFVVFYDRINAYIRIIGFNDDNSVDENNSAITAHIKEDKEKDIIIFIAYGRGTGYNAAYRTCWAIIALGDVTACLAIVDGIDNVNSITSLGYNQSVKRPIDKVRIIGN